MKISSVYIGGWFQRTMLQLSEFYDFLRDTSPRPRLSPQKLAEFRSALGVSSIEYGVAGEEYVAFLTNDQVRVKLFEDGLVILSSQQATEETLFSVIEDLKAYYENRLSPAVNYLFSSGAPAPKELTNIESIHPYFIVSENAKREDIAELLSKTERQKYFEFDNKNYSVLRGDKYYFINTKKTALGNVERYVEEQVFMREFKAQLHRYLDLHRTVWNQVDAIRSRAKDHHHNTAEIVAQLEDYEKTATLVEGRLKQMSTYIPAREHLTKEDPELTDFLAISGYRYATLHSTLAYVKDLWSMTRNYLNSTAKQFEELRRGAVVKSLKTLIIITSVAAGAAVLGLLLSLIRK